MPAPPLLQVMAVAPSVGQTGVNLRDEVSVTFGEDIETPAETDFEVHDAIGPLAGLRSYDLATRHWTWMPVFELPRGALLRAVLGTGLRGQSGSALPVPYEWTFTVRDGSLGQVADLAPAAVGQRVFAVATRSTAALACGETVYDWTAPAWHGAPAAASLGNITGLTTDGVGQLTALYARTGPQGFELSVARRPLAGTWSTETLESRPGLVLGLARLQSNLRGDLLAYWYGTGSAPASVDAAWYSPAAAPWSVRPLPAAPPYSVRATAIDDLGAVWFSHVDPQAGVLAIERQRPANASTTSYVLPVPPADWRFGVDGSGNGLAVVHNRSANEDVLWLFRSAAGSAFDHGQDVLRSANLGLRDFVVADCGESVLLYQEPADGPLMARRIDVAGGVSAPLDVTGLTLPAVATAPRGETWLVYWRASAAFPGSAELVAVRWRPRLQPDLTLVLTTAPLASTFGPVAVAVDDAGRISVGWISGASVRDLGLHAVRFQ
jgi:hypothetical protein